MNLEDLINISSQKQNIEIFVASKRIKSIKAIFSDVLEINNDYYNALMCLGLYPIQKWAKNTRNKLNIRVYDEKYMGISLGNETPLKEALNASDEILKLIEDTILILPNKNSEILTTIFIKNGEISNYKIDLYLKDALIRFVEKTYKKINRIITSVSIPKDDDVQFVFNDMKRLMELKKDICFFSNRESSYIDYSLFYENFMNIVKELNNYTLEKDIKECTELYLASKSDLEIAESLNKSNTYIRARYKLGLTLISYVLWGYFAK